MKTSPPNVETAAELPAYEKTDASLLAMGAIAFSMVLLIFITLGVSTLYLKSPYSGVAKGNRQTSFTDGASWKSSVQQDQETAKANAVRRLESYAWVDRGAGVARIPIKRAMELEATEAAKSPTASNETAKGQ